MLTYILIAAAIAVVSFVIVVARQPSTFQISRAATIGAPVAEVFARVNDLRRWAAWSPWARLDPAMVQTYSGQPSGFGAITEWSGNKQVGQGRMTIVESRPNELVRIRLEFLRPFKATNEAQFTFAPQGDDTQVTWTMSGDRNFMFKLFGLFMNMDEMIGKDFDNGLAAMKRECEATVATTTTTSASDNHQNEWAFEQGTHIGKE